MIGRAQCAPRSNAPWLDPGMIVRSEVMLVHPFRGVTFFLSGTTQAFIACRDELAFPPCDTERQS